MKSGIWFAWYPVETVDGWVWLEYVEWQEDFMGMKANEYLGLAENEYIYTKIKENN
ncbi:MAG: hypothetical protein HQK53_20060 [Oligoflexia bacterium]|nr:hypothetical protein [Oligoflexia bacterium]